jgi:hypothetical protein
MRRQKRESTPLFIGDGEFKMPGGEFDDTCSWRRKKGW